MRPSSGLVPAGQCFDDGTRRVDFVLMYEYEESIGEEENGQRRQSFQENLLKAGLQLELDTHRRQDSPNAAVIISVFVKVHVPWSVLCVEAENLKMRMPLQMQDTFADHLNEKTVQIKRLRRFVARSIRQLSFYRQKRTQHSDVQVNPLESPHPTSYPPSIWLRPFGRGKYPQSRAGHVTWPFQRRWTSRFLINDINTFFTSTQRVEIVWEVLQRARNDPNDEKKRGIESLLNLGVYKAAFPLHDGDYEPTTISQVEAGPSERERLRNTWASWRCLFMEQPIELIRSYYGEKVAFYFSFLGFYTSMLIYPAIFGAGAFLYGIFYAEHSEVVNDVCDQSKDPGNRVLCPVCQLPNCQFTTLSDGCASVKWEYMVDNPATLALACFTVIWATVFLKMWKRREAELAFDWDTYDVDLEDSSARPEYEECATEKRRNTITGEIEPHVPISTRLCRVTISLIITLIMMCGVAGALITLVFIRIQLYGALNRAGVEQYIDLSRWIVHCLILITVTLFEWAYNIVAEISTSWECPRTQSDWLRSYLWKLLIFQLFNDFAPISYAAWIKGRTSPFSLSWIWELCETGGCMSESTELIAVLLTVRLVIGNATEVAVPFLKRMWSKFRDQKLQDKAQNRRLDNDSQWHQDILLETLEKDGVAKEYMEMVIQFAFCTLFVPAFPVAPVICLLNNAIEIRVDAINFCCTHRRPLPVRVAGIELWNTFLDIILKLAILCNAGLIAFTSGIVPRLYYKYHLSLDSTLTGYTNCSLTFLQKEKWSLEEQEYFNWNNLTGCWSEDQLNDTACNAYYASHEQESEDQIWWELMTMRVIAFAIFTISSFTFQWLFNFLVPDSPAHVTAKVQRRQYVVMRTMERGSVYDRWAKRDEEKEDNMEDDKAEDEDYQDEEMEQIPKEQLRRRR